MFPAVGLMDYVALDTEDQVREAWESVNSPVIILNNMPAELKDAREQIQLAAYRLGMGILSR